MEEDEYGYLDELDPRTPILCILLLMQVVAGAAAIYRMTKVLK